MTGRSRCRKFQKFQSVREQLEKDGINLGLPGNNV